MEKIAVWDFRWAPPLQGLVCDLRVLGVGATDGSCGRRARPLEKSAQTGPLALRKVVDVPSNQLRSRHGGQNIIDAARRPHPLRQIEMVLHDLTKRFHLSGGLVHEEDDDEVLLHAGPSLTIYHITLSPGLQYPPHNHLMDALIGIYQGGETNFVYPVAAGKLGAPERRDCAAARLGASTFALGALGREYGKGALGRASCVPR